MNDQPYIPGKAINQIFPLEAYLPHLREGLIAKWLTENLTQKDWVLCPFGSSPQIALEAASAGFRVIMPVHNPILRFLIHTQANPPSRQALNSALVKLASSYKGKERLKPLLLSLYETDCPQCGAKTSATSFSWDKSSRLPVTKTCRCSACGEQSEGPVSAADITKAQDFNEQGPTYARALTRVASPDDPIRRYVESALDRYPPRSVYALFTVLNKITGFDLPPTEMADLETLLLGAFYRCSQPAGQEESLSKAEGDFYREENVWFALEDTLECWSGEHRAIPVTVWPEKPPETGGIALFPGRAKDLLSKLIGFPVQGVVMVYPSPTPLFWSLSALWTGWLWGQDAAAPLRGILSSRDLDWPWMTKAAKITLSELGEALPDNTPVLGLMAGVEAQSLLSWSSASLSAGLRLESLAVDPDHQGGQSYWTLNPLSLPSPSNFDQRTLIREAAKSLLQRSGEPKHTLSLYCAGIASLAEAGYPGQEGPQLDAGSYLPKLVKDFEENIAYRQGFLHFPRIENCWHQELELSPFPQADQIEKTLVSLLLKKSSPRQEEKIYQHIYNENPGLDTPRSSLIKACLDSYGERDPDLTAGWKLKPNENPARRLADLKEMEEILIKIGKALGFNTTRGAEEQNLILLQWEDGAKPGESFILSASGFLGKILTASQKGTRRGWLILPGSRASLLHYKMRQNPPLAEILQRDWKLIKYRHLRRLYEQGGLTRENFQERFCLDPFTSDSPQLPLI